MNEPSAETLNQARIILEESFYGHSYHTKEAICRNIAEVLNLLFDKKIVWSSEKFRQRPPYRIPMIK